MKVILKQDVPNLGEEGDVREVANGYARNYLLPKNMVAPLTKHNINLLEQSKAAIEKKKEEKRKAALSLKERLESETIILEMPAGDTGKLFGSVNNASLADALSKAGIEVEKKRIEIPSNTIKMVGDYKIKIKLYAQQDATLNVTIKQAEG